MARDGHDIAWDLVRLASASVAEWAIFPLQDVLDLGSDARMNTPGRLGGNWSWRYDGRMLNSHVSDRLAQLTELYARAVTPKPRREATTDEDEAENAPDGSYAEATGETGSIA
jgi:4-alpha-glucanotransferase